MTRACPIAILCEIFADRGIAYTGDLRSAGGDDVTINGHTVCVVLSDDRDIRYVVLMFPPDYRVAWLSSPLSRNAPEAKARAVAESLVDELERMRIICN
jgi:hypothetical protein